MTEPNLWQALTGGCLYCAALAEHMPWCPEFPQLRPSSPESRAELPQTASMSVRRRAVKARIEKAREFKARFAKHTAYLASIQQVIDSFKAEGREKITQEEFVCRLRAIEPI